MPISKLREGINNSPLKKLALSNINRIFLVILVVALILGIGSGYLLSKNSNNSITNNLPIVEKAKTAQTENRTFRDFAQGTIQKRTAPKNPNDYVGGTHLLVRDGAVPVALTSSVVDLSLYEGKKVKVFGETQKAIKEGWLMDVGKVEEEK
jgi:hypothetical protein